MLSETFYRHILNSDSNLYAFQKNLWRKIPKLSIDKGLAYQSPHEEDHLIMTKNQKPLDKTLYRVIWDSNQKRTSEAQKRESLIFLAKTSSPVDTSSASIWHEAIRSLEARMRELIEAVFLHGKQSTEILNGQTNGFFDEISELRKSAGYCPEIMGFTHLTSEELKFPNEASSYLGQSLKVRNLTVEFLKSPIEHKILLGALSLTSHQISVMPVKPHPIFGNAEIFRFLLEEEYPALGIKLEKPKSNKGYGAQSSYDKKTNYLKLSFRQKLSPADFGLAYGHESDIVDFICPDESEKSVIKKIKNFDDSFARVYQATYSILDTLNTPDL
ncbi:MAG: hypothetical protein SFT81_03490 [Candidatus Caenarcaniphilales bacterium]|nr:hypothetical protein [Candidatus Caenarcaniphilales bacterium]